MILLHIYARVQRPRTQALSSLSHFRLSRRVCRQFVNASKLRYRNPPVDSKPLIQNPSAASSQETFESQAIPTVPNAKSNGVVPAPDLLTEQTVSNQAQRKADWAIMKEMSRYLWPKVCEGRSQRMSQCLTMH